MKNILVIYLIIGVICIFSCAVSFGVEGGVIIGVCMWLAIPFVLFLALLFLGLVKSVLFGSKAKIQDIDRFYKQGVLKNDLAALDELISAYDAGEDAGFFRKNPKQAQEVFEGALHLVELLENGYKGRKLELEDYYYLGLMYEEGFASVPDLAQAVNYYKKALTTTDCWDGTRETYMLLCKEVQDRLEKLSSI